MLIYKNHKTNVTLIGSTHMGCQKIDEIPTSLLDEIISSSGKVWLELSPKKMGQTIIVATMVMLAFLWLCLPKWGNWAPLLGKRSHPFGWLRYFISGTGMYLMAIASKPNYTFCNLDIELGIDHIVKELAIKNNKEVHGIEDGRLFHQVTSMAPTSSDVRMALKKRNSKLLEAKDLLELCIKEKDAWKLRDRAMVDSPWLVRSFKDRDAYMASRIANMRNVVVAVGAAHIAGILENVDGFEPVDH